MLVAEHCRSTPILMGHELRTDLWFELNDAPFHYFLNNFCLFIYRFLN